MIKSFYLNSIFINKFSFCKFDTTLCGFQYYIIVYITIESSFRMNNTEKKITIAYTFQNQDQKQFEGSNLITLNVDEEESTIKDIVSVLPLDYSINSYHFRFKTKINENGNQIICWMDITNFLEKAPLSNNAIHIKILTIPHNTLNKASITDQIGNHPITNLLESEDLIDFNKPREERNSEIPNKTSIFLKNLLQRDQSNCIPPDIGQANWKLAEQEFRQRLLNWGYSKYNIINPLTKLLLTLHTIWPEWDPISVAQICCTAGLNKIFKKAIIRVHPDKHWRKDFRTQYLARSIFELLIIAKKAEC